MTRMKLSWPKALISAFLISTSLLAVTACSNETLNFTSVEPSEVSTEPPAGSTGFVTQEEFDSAAKSFEVKADEFDDSVTITQVFPKNTLKAGVSKGKSFAILTVAALKQQDSNSFEFTLGVAYHGSDWLFFESVDLKSSTGSMEIPFNAAKTENVGSGGRVEELGLASLSDSQIRELTELVLGKALKFRLSGTGDKLGDDFTGNFTDWMRVNVRDGMTLARGLRQGLTFP